MKNLERILILNVHKKDKAKMNDFADLNSELLLKHFGTGSVFYFSDSVRDLGVRKTEAIIEKTVRESGIGVVFFAPNGDNYELTIDFFKGLKNRTGCKCVLWMLDDEMIFDTYSKYYAQAFDAAVTTDYYASFAYRKLGVPAVYYFSSYYKDDFHPVDTEKDIDVSFIGDCTKGNRLDYIRHLRENGIDVMTFGDGTEAGFVSKEDMRLIFSRSKVNLNFTRLNRYTPSSWFLEENALSNIIRQNKGRPMEIALTNSFCLSEYSASLSVTFQPGVDIDVFHDKETLLQKTRFYIDRDEQRSALAGRAYTKALQNYEADVFFPALSNEVKRILEGPVNSQTDERVYKDEVFKKNHIIKLTILMFYQALRLKLAPAVESFASLFQYGAAVFIASFLKGLKISLFKAFSKV